MSGRLPEYIDPFRLADAGQALRGSLALARFKRLTPFLNSGEGEVAVELRFGVDEGGQRYLRGHISAELELVCQRCLGPMAQAIETDMRLGLVESAAEGDQLPGAYEPLVVEEPPISVADVIEDELILALPLVAMHPREECPASDRVSEGPSEDSGTDTENPFAVLANMKLTKGASEDK